MRNVLDSGNFVFKIQACCGSDLSPSPYSVTFHLLPNPNNCFTLQYTGNNFAGHLTPPVINNNNGEGAMATPVRQTERAFYPMSRVRFARHYCT